MIKAIETKYKGYRFRSRLEARWAVFFDSLGLQWEYEPEGFDLGDLGWYLPDFKVYSFDCNGDKFSMWVEVKGSHPNLDEIKKCEKLSTHQGFAVALVIGMPFENECMLWAADTCDSGGGCWHGSAFIYWDGGVMSIGCDDPRVDKDRSIFMTGCDFIHPVESSTIMRQYISEKARSARFEYGETPC